jgi:transcriptional regulator with XRE-family HTH domain
MDTESKGEPLAVLVGRRVRDLRLERGLSLAMIEQRSGVYASSVSRLENGRVNATLDTLEAVARALDVELFDLLNVGQGVRAAVIDATRTMTRRTIKGLLAKVPKT